MPRHTKLRRHDERGFALLLVFMMAAGIGLMLYREMPRLVFESQRISEQKLIDHGEEYKRAIELYVRKYKKYPASLDDLETSDVRFLRRRYKDPMTGEEEWRIVHIDNMGFYTDSLIHKPQEEEEEEKSTNNFITEGAAFGSTELASGAEGQAGGAGVRGASDRPAADIEQFRGTSPVPGQPGYTADSGQSAAVAGAQTGQPGIPVQNFPPGFIPGVQSPAMAQQPGSQQVPGSYPQGIPGLPGPYGQQATNPRPYPNQAGPNQFITPNASATSTQPSGLPRPYANQAGPNQYVAPGATTPQDQSSYTAGASNSQGSRNPAAELISNLLRSPRPGGLSGITSSANTASGAIPGGIAGVATTLEAEGIMVYNDRTKYQEWEFLYDYREEQAAAAESQARAAGASDEPNSRNPLGNQNRRSGFDQTMPQGQYPGVIPSNRSGGGGGSLGGGFIPPAPTSGSRQR